MCSDVCDRRPHVDLELSTGISRQLRHGITPPSPYRGHEYPLPGNRDTVQPARQFAASQGQRRPSEPPDAKTTTGEPMRAASHPVQQGMYDPRNEHDACGVGFVATLTGEASHELVDQALTVLRNLE